MPEIVEIRSRRKLCRTIGVSPLGPQVFRTFGIRRNPLSSRKTRWAPSCFVFFYLRPFDRLPPRDSLFVALGRPTNGLLATPVEAPHQGTDMVTIVRDVEMPANDIRDPLRSPKVCGVTKVWGALAKQTQERLMFRNRQLRRAPRNGFRPQAPEAVLVPGLPPPRSRALGAAYQEGDLDYILAGFEHSRSQPPARFELRGCTMGSHAPDYTRTP